MVAITHILTGREEDLHPRTETLHRLGHILVELEHPLEDQHLAQPFDIALVGQYDRPLQWHRVVIVDVHLPQ